MEAVLVGWAVKLPGAVQSRSDSTSSDRGDEVPEPISLNLILQFRQRGVAWRIFVDENDGRFPDQQDLKDGLLGGYKPWSIWPPSDPRADWAAEAIARKSTLQEPAGGVCCLAKPETNRFPSHASSKQHR